MLARLMPQRSSRPTVRKVYLSFRKTLIGSPMTSGGWDSAQRIRLQKNLDSAKNDMLISAPFLLVFSAALCVSNLALLRHEGRRLVNVLGIVLAFLLVAGAAFLFRFDFYASGSQTEEQMT